MSVIRSLYTNIKSSVIFKGKISPFFNNDLGVLQGEIISPLLFALYVNDCEMSFLKSGVLPLELQELSLFLLMYADDLVLFSESIEGMQSMLNCLKDYTSEWSLTVNVSKTKIVVFRNGGKVRNNESWYYDNEPIVTVDKFSYLGLVFNFNGKFTVAQKNLSLQSRKAVFALKSKCSPLYLNHVTLLSLFDTYVSSVCNYACEVWGFHTAPDIEKVHLDYCKNILGVKRSTPNSMVYNELGRYPLICIRKIRIIKYWLKLIVADNCILRNAYEYLYEQCEAGRTKNNWAYCVKQELCSLGLSEIWINQKLMNPKYILSIVKQRIFDQCKQSFDSFFASSSKCALYKFLSDHITLQNYLCKPIPQKYKKN